MIATRRSTALANAHASSRARDSLVRVGAGSLGQQLASSLVTIAVVGVVAVAGILVLVYVTRGAS
jgi:hypothetical protein